MEKCCLLFSINAIKCTVLEEYFSHMLLMLVRFLSLLRLLGALLHPGMEQDRSLS